MHFSSVKVFLLFFFSSHGSLKKHCVPKKPFVKYKALLQECSLASTNFAASLCTNFAAAFLLVMSEFLEMCIQGSSVGRTK